MSEAAPDATFMSNIRPLTAGEYIDILTTHPVELRVSDGTSDGTWRFWIEGNDLFYRRLSWTQNKHCDESFLQNVLDDGGTTQLITSGEV